MAKKIIAFVLVVSLTAAIAIGGTLAYLTDRDSEANVFTTGDVNIDLNEDFEQGSTLIPGVDIEKEPTVTNAGPNDAWVWTTVAVPKNLASVIDFDASGEGWKAWTEDTATIDGEEYVLYTILHEEALAVGDETTALFTKVTLDKTVDIDPDGQWHTVVGGTATDLGWNNADGNPVIHVSAYAVQKEGFDTVGEAYAAYQTQWGTNGTEYESTPTLVASAQELEEAVNSGKTAVVVADFTIPDAAAYAQYAKIDLNGHTLSSNGMNFQAGAEISNGAIESAQNTLGVPHLKVSGGTLTMENVKVTIDDNMNDQSSYAEYVGMEVNNAEAVLNNCDLFVKNETVRRFNYVYAVVLNKGELTMNGGSITVESADGTTTDCNTAICGIGNSKATLNDVAVTTDSLGTTMGHLILNTTDAAATDADIVSYGGGTFELNTIN